MTISPAFILVRPQLGENIGAAARVMKNFAFTDLRIVAPRDGWPNPAAQGMAAGGADVLEGAKLYDTAAEAVADVQKLYATTARPRDMVKPAIWLEELGLDFGGDAVPPLGLTGRSAKHEVSSLPHHKTAFLFGPERTGLENEEVALADEIVSVRINPEYPSLNLAQTVALVAYQCSQVFDNKLLLNDFSSANAHPEGANLLADKAALNGFLGQLEAALDAANFWKVDAKKEKMWINIRNIFTRAGLSEQEVRTLRGMVRSLGGK